MCGRFVSASPPDELANYFGTEVPEQALEESYNVAPTNEVYVVRARESHRTLAPAKWGLVPFWAKDAKIGSRMINARSETAPAKPAFRRAFSKRRCLIPADGFYEWAAQSDEVIEAAKAAAKAEGRKFVKPKKQPFYIYRADEEPLVFGGLWERWIPKDEDGNDIPDADPLDSCTILTCAANNTMAPVHDRMPVMIPPNAWDDWLDPESDADHMKSLLVPAPDALLTMHTITTMVNSVRNKGAELIAPGVVEPPV